jgi:hypothetical protein
MKVPGQYVHETQVLFAADFTAADLVRGYFCPSLYLPRPLIFPSKEFRKGGKPALWLSRLSTICHFHAPL